MVSFLSIVFETLTVLQLFSEYSWINLFVKNLQNSKYFYFFLLFLFHFRSNMEDEDNFEELLS